MPIIGERITKLHAERGKLERKMEIKSNVDLTDVSIQNIGVAAEAKKGLAFAFKFTTQYGKEGGHIDVEGEVFYMDSEDKMKEIEDGWKKNKKFDDKLKLAIMNRILEIAYLQAIALADQVRLPPPIQMPRFVTKK